MAKTASQNLSKLLAYCARTDVIKLAKQYNIAAETVLEDEDHETRMIGLKIAKAIDAIGNARFSTIWENVRDDESAAQAA